MTRAPTSNSRQRGDSGASQRHASVTQRRQSDSTSPYAISRQRLSALCLSRHRTFSSDQGCGARLPLGRGFSRPHRGPALISKRRKPLPRQSAPRLRSSLDCGQSRFRFSMLPGVLRLVVRAECPRVADDACALLARIFGPRLNDCGTMNFLPTTRFNVFHDSVERLQCICDRRGRDGNDTKSPRKPIIK